MDEDTKKKIERLAESLGQDLKDIKFQEGILMGQHVKECKFCSMLWAAAQEITGAHVKESMT